MVPVPVLTARGYIGKSLKENLNRSNRLRATNYVHLNNKLFLQFSPNQQTEPINELFYENIAFVWASIRCITRLAFHLRIFLFLLLQ